MLLAGLVFIFIACQKEVPINNSKIVNVSKEKPIDKIVEWAEKFNSEQNHNYDVSSVSERNFDDHCGFDANDPDCVVIPPFDLPVTVNGCGMFVIMSVQACGSNGSIDVFNFSEERILISITCGVPTEEMFQEAYNGCLLYTSPSPRDRG